MLLLWLKDFRLGGDFFFNKPSRADIDIITYHGTNIDRRINPRLDVIADNSS